MLTATEGKPSVVSPIALFERIKAGDHDAFDQLYSANHARVLAAVKHYISEPDIAEFIANGVFMKVWEVRNTPASFKGQSSLATWLTRIAITQALMYIRKHRTESSHIAYSLDEPQQRGTSDSSGETLLRSDSFASRDLKLEGVFNRRDELEEAIDHLPRTCREILELRLIDGMSTEEACEVLHLKSNAVKSRLFRTRRILQAILNSKKVRSKSRITRD